MRSLNSGMYLAAANAAYSMIRHGGYSAKIETLEEPAEGYMVAIELLKKYPNISSVNTHEVSGLLREYCSKLDQSLLYIGSWQDPETNEVYFEVSLNIDDLEKAKNIGNIHDQKYIWDVVNKKNIKL